MTSSKHPHRTTLRAGRAPVTLACGCACGGAAALVVFALACGRTSEIATTDSGADGASGSSPSGDAFAPSFDGSITPVDADTTPIDAGVAPIVSCTDAGAMCAPPPSDCLDDHTMRYFSGGTCNDAGTCDFTISTLHCDPSPMPPDCYQGGCRVVIVR